MNKEKSSKKTNIYNLIKTGKDLLAEIKRRKSCPLYSYNNGKIVHEKQLEFHKNLKRNRWVFGGNRSGKTECGAVETIWLARGIHPFRENKKDVFGWVVSLSTKVQKEVAQEKILKYLDKSFIEEIIMNTGKKISPEYGVIDTIVIKNVCQIVYCPASGGSPVQASARRRLNSANCCGELKPHWKQTSLTVSSLFFMSSIARFTRSWFKYSSGAMCSESTNSLRR